MNPVLAIILIGVIAAGMVIMLGAVQTARLRATTRKRLAEAIPATSASQALGTVTHQAGADRVRRATEELDVGELRKADDDARAMEER